MTGIEKKFGSVAALSDVDLEAAAGTIHAVVGENGAGKTTLLRILYGALAPDAGIVEIEGRPTRFRTSKEAIASGIGMVSQHYSILPELDCLQNLILGAEPGPILNRPALEERAQSLASQMGFEFTWNQLASELSPGAAQKLEILKLLWRDSKVLILDEPTAMLSPDDSEALFACLRRLADAGATIIVVTHRLAEVLAHCNAVTVLRGGRKVVDAPTDLATLEGLSEAVVGHALPRSTPRGTLRTGGVTLGLRKLAVRGYRGNMAVESVDLELREGELLGLAGVDGNGQRELCEAILGVRPRASGDMLWKGMSIAECTTASRIELGFRAIPEDRHAEAVIEAWSLIENAALGLQRLAPFAAHGLIDLGGRESASMRIADRFQTQRRRLGQSMASLSGGNQQRFVAGRALEVAPRLVVAFQPARGLDIDATRRVYDALRGVCADGASALVVSFDLDELLDQADRIGVFYGGRLRFPAPGLERDRAELGRLMVGAK